MLDVPPVVLYRDGETRGLSDMPTGWETGFHRSGQHFVDALLNGTAPSLTGEHRVMAKDAVDAAVRGLPERVPASCTHRLPLLGAEGYQAAWNQRAIHARRCGLSVWRVEHLLRRYGSLTAELLELIAEQPWLGEPLAGAESYLNAEIYCAVRAEGALHLDDLLSRRTHVSIETPDQGRAAARPAARIAAPLLGWDQDDIDGEVARYHARVEAELQSRTGPDDHRPAALQAETPAT